ncbi:siroheme synthase CysG [Chitiniphilus shinanonensis]|nr:siroheme synthase CysG [Chitiniphilus shinanonensis]
MFDARATAALAAVVKEGSFERAAHALRLTQSAVSQRVRALETSLGQTLLTRGRPCVPTAAGQTLLRYLDRIRLLEEEARRALAGDEAGAEAELEATLASGDADALARGAVYLVGAGPGNPDLLTFRALRLMQRADVVLYDNLVSPAIVDLVRRDAERLYVGKKASNHALPQEDINKLLVRLAREGKTVLRLKGGDPFIFGRGGEEIEELAAAGIEFQVVPGITSAAGASCYAGIPLTHRDHAQSVTFVTGHRRGEEIELDWPRLTSPSETIVVYMGVAQAPRICAQLIAHGRAPDTPAAIVEKATLPDQRTLVGTLETLPGLLATSQVKPPALIIIGNVVRLAEKLGWRPS